MDQSAINRRQRQFRDKAKSERLTSPEIIQPGRAVQFRPVVRRAIATEDAATSATFKANLYNINGVEQESGKESDVTVHCIAYGITNLNEAVPPIEKDNDLFVVKLPYNNNGQVEYRWFCVNTFHSPFVIKILNNSGSTFNAYRFVKIDSYDDATGLYTAIKPNSMESGLARLKLGQIAVVNQPLSHGDVGYAYIGGCHKVEIYDSNEDIAQGDPVGPDDDTGKAIKGGPFVCLKVDGSYVWVKPNGV